MLRLCLYEEFNSFHIYLKHSNTLLERPVKPVLSVHSKIDNTKVLKTGGSLVQIESIAECSTGAFCSTFDLHYAIIGLEKMFWDLLSGSLRQILLC